MNFRFHHVLLALFVHLLLAAMLLTEVECSKPLEAPQVVQGVIMNAPPKPVANQKEQENVAREKTPDEVAATTHDAPQLSAEAAASEEAIKAQEAQARQQAQELTEQQQAAAKQAAAEAAEKAQILAQQKQAQDAQLKAQAEEQRKAEADAQAKSAALAKAKADADAKAKADALAAQQAQAAAQKKADADQKARADKLAQQTAAADAKQKADQDAKKRALDKAAHDADEQRQRERELASALGSELSQQQIGTEKSTWGNAVSEAIHKVWRRPLDSDSSTTCTVNIRLLPNGQVIGASIKSPSGNGLFDDSVIAAVYKASPVPLPDHNEAFDSSINIKFHP